MTTHQPPAQPDYLTELAATALHLGHVFDRANALLNSLSPGSDEWTDCCRVQTALHMASQLVNDARDRERARNAPVPFLPAEVIEQASALIAGAVEAGVPVIVEDGS